MQFEIKTYADFKAAVEALCSYLLEREIAEERVFDSKLVLHELIGNALEHSGCGALLQTELTEEFIGITVRGEKAYRPPRSGVCPPCGAERGRGFYLIDSVAAERLYTDEGEIVVKIRIKE